MTTPGSFGAALKESDYKRCAEFLVIAGINGHLSLEEAINSLYNDYIRLKREDDKRLEKAELVNSLEPGDIVTVEGTGEIDRAGFMNGKIAYFIHPSSVKFEVTKVNPFGLIQIKWADEESENRWSVHPNTIVSVTKADKSVFKERRINRTDRRVESDTVLSGSHLHVVRCLEAYDSRNASLNEDQREVLAQAQAMCRRDCSVNGFRKGLDRRKF